MTPAFEQLIKQTAKKFADKKAPKSPETQWRKGAEWMYDLLTGGKTVDIYIMKRHVVCTFVYLHAGDVAGVVTCAQ